MRRRMSVIRRLRNIFTIRTKKNEEADEGRIRRRKKKAHTKADADDNIRRRSIRITRRSITRQNKDTAQTSHEADA